MYCSFLSGDFKFQVSPKVLISSFRSTSRGQKCKIFSRCIHFLEVSRYADLGTVIMYWCMADPSACRDWYFHPAWNDFDFGDKKMGQVLGITGGDEEKVTCSFFKTAEV